MTFSVSLFLFIILLATIVSTTLPSFMLISSIQGQENDGEDENGEDENGEDENGEDENNSISSSFGNSNEAINNQDMNTYVDSDIIIKSVLKSGTFFKSNLYVPESSTTFTFSNENELCPTNDCEYKFLDGDFDKTLFGGKEDRIFHGTLKIEDKENSNDDFKAFNLYKVSGVLELQTIKQNSKTGEIIYFYGGELDIDKEDTIFNPEFTFEIQSKYFPITKEFELMGEIKD